MLLIGNGKKKRTPGGVNWNGSNTRGKEKKDLVVILTIGSRLNNDLLAANDVEEQDLTLGVTFADARFMKRLDVDLVRQLAEFITCEITKYGMVMVQYCYYTGGVREIFTFKKEI